MPIYEFRCLACNEVFELLTMRSEEENEIKCPKCGAEHFERVMSSTNYAMNQGSGSSVSRQTRSCSSGSCTTYEIPGCN